MKRTKANMSRFQSTNPSTITFNRRVSKYYITFGGATIETTITATAATAAEWVAEISTLYDGIPMVVGLDVEWRPHLVPSMSNKSATLQLCIGVKCLILQLFYMDEIPESLKNFLLNPNFTFVGIEVGDDILKLKNEYGLDCSSSRDVREAAKERWPGRFRRPGLKDLALEVCGLNMRKPIHVCKSNWEARELSKYQIEYACLDAYASYMIGHKLLIEA